MTRTSVKKARCTVHEPRTNSSDLMPRIAIVTPILPVPFDMTRGRFIYEISKSLTKLTETRVFLQMQRYPLASIRPKSYVYGEIDDQHQLDGIHLETFNYPSLPVVSRGLNGWVSSLYLEPRLRKFKPDVVIGYWVYPDGEAALRVARKLGVPCVIGALGSDIHMREGISRKLTRRTLERADAVITVSQAMTRYTQQEYGVDPARIHTVVNGFNTQIFHWREQLPARKKLGIAPDQQLIIYIGRLVEAKGLRELMAAFSCIQKSNPRLKLVLIGDGVMRDELHQMIQKENLNDKVLMPGGLPPDQVATWIAASDALTLPSWSEGYPNVVVEAVACGRPVVATDVGGIREILHNNNGILVPPKQIGPLQSALMEVLTRTWDHRSIAANMTRSWDDVARETLAICDMVMKLPTNAE